MHYSKSEISVMAAKLGRGGGKKTAKRGSEYMKKISKNGTDKRWKNWREKTASFSKEEKNKARISVKKAKIAGTLMQRSCEVCGNSKTDAHHEDYSKPLEVRWLCRKHHAPVH